MIASPEYNASIPGVLKNAIDWVSRFRPQPFHERHGLLLSASPSMVGGNRSLWALRVPLEHLGARSTPTCSRSRRRTRCSRTAASRVPMLQERLDTTIGGFMDLVEAAKHYPCIKRDWIEFLGEHRPRSTSPALD